MSPSIEIAYLFATAMFIFSLHWMNDPKTARRGVIAGSIAMLVAVLATCSSADVNRYWWILLPVIPAVVVGYWLAQVPLTAVPQRTALSHAFGGLAAGLVGTAKYFFWLDPGDELTKFRMCAIIAEIILGYLTFTGSLIAAAKLQELKWIPQRPWVYRGQIYVNLGAIALAVLLGLLLIFLPDMRFWSPAIFIVIILISLNFGWMLVMPIGGADMPTVISILNAYAGLSAVAMGFVLDNKLLITAGALDGSSGLILSIIMCKAMNRSFLNVLFGAFGQVQSAVGGEKKTAKSETPEGAAQIMEQASLVVIVPGYGMAVAQAQHRVRELFDQLTRRGIDVRFAIHPVAGRMPGHMNVLLAEAEIPYDRLIEMDDINHDIPQADVVLVIGANDVVNPAARTDKTSPIYGMPIIDADKARMCLCIKRSMNPGFAGIENELYYADRTFMLFGDAKQVVGELVKQLAGSSGLH